MASLQQPVICSTNIIVGPGHVSNEDWPNNLVNKMKLDNSSFEKPAKSLGGSTSMFDEEFKMVSNGKSENIKPTQIQRAKDTIRKLPMFETYDQAIGSYDFEWPP